MVVIVKTCMAKTKLKVAQLVTSVEVTKGHVESLESILEELKESSFSKTINIITNLR